MAITVRLGSNTVKIEAPNGKKLKDLIISVSEDYPVSGSVQATVEGNLVTPEELVPDNSRVILTQPSGEKG